MKKILMFLFVLIFLGKVYAQTASITGTVTDSDSQLWLNGTWTYTFYPNVNYPNLNSYYVGSTPLSTYYNAPVSGILDPSAATFTMSNMVRSDKISPSGSMWTLQFCPNATSKCGSFNYNLTADSVTGSTINSLITAAIPAPRFEPIAGAFGYNDTEAIINPTAGTPGGTYWNVISACQRYYSNMSPIGWACGSGSSGGSITGQANGVIPLATGATSIGAQSHIDDGVTTPSTVTSTEGIAAPNYIGPVQQFQPYTLRSTLTKTGLMALYTAGNASYTSPAQLNIMMLGDSTGFMHTGVIPCQLTAAYGAAGYMGQQLGSNVSGIGFNCATSAGGNAPTLAGGAYWVDGSTYAFDFAHSPNGQYWVIPPG